MIWTLTALALVGTAFAVALAALFAFALLDRGHRDSLRRLARSERGKVVFLFEGPHLLDASPAARQMLDLANGPGVSSDWARLSTLLKPRFDAFSDLETSLADLGEMVLASRDGLTTLVAEWHDGIARLRLISEEMADSGPHPDRQALDAMSREIEILRSVAENVPYLTWRENARGEIIWANQAYLEIADAIRPGADTLPWPPQRLFDDDALAQANGGAPARAALALPDEAVEHWFEIHGARLGDETLFSAMPADVTVRAERALSEFVTTLTKTFAHLPIGLAIFDHSRRLSLFNPALTDLTMLPAEFLCGQPSLFAFLDRLRDKRMIPEPKDYKTWRQRMTDLEEMAMNGSYMETWHLPTGQTYRVTGRPHPDGAVAFLFEDISAEISLTRRFRTELDTSQAVLDAMPEAVAVFNSAGVLTLSNQAYAALWGTDPSTSLLDITATDATASWQALCNPTPVWRQLRSYLSEAGERHSWAAPVTLKDGRGLSCRFEALPQGGTLAAFAISAAAQDPRSAPAPALVTAQR